MRARGADEVRGSGRPIFFPDGLPAGPEIFSRLAVETGLRAKTYSPRKVDTAALDALIAERPALFVVPTSVRLDRDVFSRAAGSVICFASVSTGTDHVDLTASQESGIPFLHAPGVNADSVAEYVAAAAVHAQGRLPGPGETAGIVGYGRIGKKVRVLLEMLGYSVRWYDPLIDEQGGSSFDLVLDSHLVTFHVPLTVDGQFPTHGMMNESAAAKLRPGNIVMNTSRGRVFTPDAFMKVCGSHPTVMDVFPTEPPDERLVRAPTLVTPHVAGYNYTARAGGTLVIARQFARCVGVGFSGSIPEVECSHNVIDFFAEESEMLKKNPASFSERRENYPHRGDAASACSTPSASPLGALIREKLCAR